MPPAADAGCDLIPSERFYRFVNVKQEEDETDDIGFDPIPFAPRFISQSVHYGHYLLVGEDPTAAVYLGFDTNYTFLPSFFDRQNEILAHSISDAPYSYEARIGNLLATARNSSSDAVSTDGFREGTICEPSYVELCATGSCQDFSCAARVQETCIEGSCQQDSDCATGVCIWDACAVADGEVADGCPCGLGSSCASGTCDRSFSFEFDWTCSGAGGAVPGVSASLVIAIFTAMLSGVHLIFGS